MAAGHQETAQAASAILLAGGNAFDAAVAAMLTACVAEPVLASLGGGGFLTARPRDSEPVVYDFFAQTPAHKQAPEAIDFYPIVADFGTARQAFHIGMGSIATPGLIRGLFIIHKELCRMPLRTLMEPAIQLARNGVKINSFQHLIASIVSPILLASDEVLALHASPVDSRRLIQEGELHRQPELADFLDTLWHEGEDLFYAGEAGQSLVEACRKHGGHLRQLDLHNYTVQKRNPITHRYRDASLVTNPLPSFGGILINFSLSLLASISLPAMRSGSESHLRSLARTLCLTQQLRNENTGDLVQVLGIETHQAYCHLLNEGGICNRGTTQISIADRRGNLASLTLSNGEGAGYAIPGTGIMLNNMLGEEDLHPCGFHHWPENRRIASMMAPTLVFLDDGRTVVTGSGGSNRIRSAILQVVSNLVDFAMPLQQAVAHPRIHFENDLLSSEPDLSVHVLKAFEDEFPRQQHWDKQNLFFGGAHTVMTTPQRGLAGTGDVRRGGVAIVS